MTPDVLATVSNRVLPEDAHRMGSDPLLSFIGFAGGPERESANRAGRPHRPLVAAVGVVAVALNSGMTVRSRAGPA
jgi:hypothetical protein